MMENILSLTVKSTHFFLLDCKGGKLLLDAGWELSQFTAQLSRYQIPIRDIRYVMFTHTHPDHAGLVQDIRSRSGAKLIIHSVQIPYLAELEAFLVRKGGGKTIQLMKGDLVSPDRSVLQGIGIQGEILLTPGHSDDSISLALDTGAVFTGDLALPGFVTEEQATETCRSWRMLVQHGVKQIYPSHVDPFPVERVQSRLEEYCDTGAPP